MYLECECAIFIENKQISEISTDADILKFHAVLHYNWHVCMCVQSFCSVLGTKAKLLRLEVKAQSLSIDYQNRSDVN
ncbi:hypothetical protein T4B_11857 [Trichinella pseudospiralis]|uniref:Uncharacterized protein n=1 Tax=Trichinella pseudospiralis TaxID=6337 RepID=A0A0V1JGR4_TRIPS|nr:hypothetical protein T4B_11857 [Trichinella pseudospiralis]KRZ44931.1 hypothetical protein T4C_5981 [Trichinella pseudospiralis]